MAKIDGKTVYHAEMVLVVILCALLGACDRVGPATESASDESAGSAQRFFADLAQSLANESIDHEAIDGLRSLGSEAAPILERAVQSENEYERLAVVYAISGGCSVTQDCLDGVVMQLSDSFTRPDAGRCLTGVGVVAVPAVVRRIDAVSDGAERRDLLRRLGVLLDACHSVTDEIESIATVGDVDVRRIVAEKVARFSDTRSRALLSRLSRDPDDTVRRMAMQSNASAR